ncbi:hypothetical protein L3Q82_000602 [Scortum barcoo]|uniref:Uncharacterized protein n=1 Tax=Scortum barcoo TaxID=214431 RepID=A0ACB8WFA1_9TELE|nr:hypothetical protein L3Q82_000602 [Scortum barcoo]
MHLPLVLMAYSYGCAGFHLMHTCPAHVEERASDTSRDGFWQTPRPLGVPPGPEYARRLQGVSSYQLQKVGMRQKRNYDMRARGRDFKAEDLVLVYSTRRRKGRCPKLDCHWVGPWEVLEKLGEVVYRVQLPPRGRRVALHRDRSPIWNNNGVSLTFHIPRIDIKGVVKVCVLLPDGSCHGNATIIYQSSPSCTNTAPRSSWVSGKREITLTGSHLEFAEGVVHSLLLQEVRPPRNTDFKHLTYYTPAAGNAQSSFTSSVFLRVANETLPCTTITYYPDPEFTSFETIRTGDDVLITVQKKADKLEMTPEELTVWGINEDKQYPCIMEGKTNNNKPEFFICQIQSPPSATFEQLMMQLSLLYQAVMQPVRIQVHL